MSHYDTPSQPIKAPPLAVAIASIFVIPIIALALLVVWPIAPLLAYCAQRKKNNQAAAEA